MSGGLTYGQAVAYLREALTFGIHPSLDGIRSLTQAMERPQDSFACVQVTGTNGKSSVVRMTAAILNAHGVRAGAYTSPELQSYTERIELDGAPVSEGEFARAIGAARDAVAMAAAAGYAEPVTEFELLTAGALWLLRDAKVDFGVLEVGMGGRWDATSVVDPTVAVVTGVGLDHTAHLGTTRDAIAADKAHIIKPASAPILGPATEGVDHLLLARAEECDTHARAVRPHGRPTPVSEDLTIRYAVARRSESPDGVTVATVRGVHADYGEIAVSAPAYQAPNVATAIAAAEAALGRALDAGATARALAELRFPGRFEVLARDPWVVIDGAHNPQAARALAKTVSAAWPDPAIRPVVVLAVLADKDAEGIVGALADVTDRFVCTTNSSPRALGADTLADVVERVTGTRPDAAADVPSAVRTALELCADAGILATGSFVTAGEVRSLYR